MLLQGDISKMEEAMYALCFWYDHERSWTIVNTNVKIKPRKEASEYQKGDQVVAKYQGKPLQGIY